MNKRTILIVDDEAQVRVLYVARGVSKHERVTDEVVREKFGVAAAALGTAYGMLLVGGLREIQRIAGPDDLAGLTAVYYSLTYLGFFIPAILAALGAWITYSAMFLAGSLIAALSLGVVAMSGRRHLPTG